MTLSANSGGFDDQIIGMPASTDDSRPLRPRRRSHRALALSYLVTILALVTLNFFLPRAMPGDPITALTNEGTPDYVRDAAIRTRLEAYYGLDRPLLSQFGRYLRGLTRGDLGVSIRYSIPVRKLVEERLPWTLLLVGSAILMAVTVGWVAGIHSAWRRGRGADLGLLTTSLVLRSFPPFFLGSLAVLVFSVKLGWFPLAGSHTPFSQPVNALVWALDVARHLTLPASVLALAFTASQYLTMRASMVGELGADYLRLGRAKGLRDRRIKYRYGARNALLPAVTLAALDVGMAMTEVIVIETVFAYQGMGRLMSEAVSYRDYPTLGGCFLVLSLVVVSANFLADVLYRRLDPRTTG